MPNRKNKTSKSRQKTKKYNCAKNKKCNKSCRKKLGGDFHKSSQTNSNKHNNIEQEQRRQELLEQMRQVEQERRSRAIHSMFDEITRLHEYMNRIGLEFQHKVNLSDRILKKMKKNNARIIELKNMNSSEEEIDNIDKLNGELVKQRNKLEEEITNINAEHENLILKYGEMTREYNAMREAYNAEYGHLI